jgi:hypothetical protein
MSPGLVAFSSFRSQALERLLGFLDTTSRVAELPCQFAPQGANDRAVGLHHRISGRDFVAYQDDPVDLRQFWSAGLRSSARPSNGTSMPSAFAVLRLTTCRRPAAANAAPSTAFALGRPRPVHLALSSLPPHSGCRPGTAPSWARYPSAEPNT